MSMRAPVCCRRPERLTLPEGEPSSAPTSRTASRPRSLGGRGRLSSAAVPVPPSSPRAARARVGRLTSAVLVAGALLGLIAGCSGGDDGNAAGPAALSGDVPAIVGDVGIERDRVLADLAAEADAAEAGRSAASDSALADPVGDDGEYLPAAKAAALTNRILDQVYAQTLEREAIGITAADEATARETLCADASTGRAPSDGSCPPLEGYPEAYRTFTTRLVQRQVAFGRNLYEQAFADVKERHPELLDEVCVNLVQTADTATAEQIRDAVADGSSLGDAIAAPVKDGKASESREGCLFVDDAPEGLQKAADGDVVAVSDGELSYVAQVLRHKTASKDEFTTQPPSSETVRTIVDRRVAAAVKTSGVEVEKTWGTWEEDSFGVVPPGESGSTTTSDPLAPSTTAPGTTAPATTGPSTTTPATTAPG